MVGVDGALAARARLASARTLRLLGDGDPSEDAVWLFRRCGRSCPGGPHTRSAVVVGPDQVSPRDPSRRLAAALAAGRPARTSRPSTPYRRPTHTNLRAAHRPPGPRGRSRPCARCRSAHRSVHHRTPAAPDRAPSPPTASCCPRVGSRRGIGSGPAKRRTAPSAGPPPRGRHVSPSIQNPGSVTHGRVRRQCSAPAPLRVGDRAPRRALRALIPHRHQPPMRDIGADPPARTLHPLSDLLRERIHARTRTHRHRQPAASLITNAHPVRDHLVITPSELRCAAQRPPGRTLPGSPLPPESSSPPPRGASTTGARSLQAGQDKAAGRSASTTAGHRADHACQLDNATPI